MTFVSRKSSMWRKYKYHVQIYSISVVKINTVSLIQNWKHCKLQVLQAVPLFTTIPVFHSTWWRHQMETFSALLALCAVNSPVTGEFASQRSVTRSFDVFSDPLLNKRLNNKSRRRWYETPSCSLWRQCSNTQWPGERRIVSLFCADTVKYYGLLIRKGTDCIIEDWKFKLFKRNRKLLPDVIMDRSSVTIGSFLSVAYMLLAIAS